MDWFELSQRNVGLILTGKKHAQGYKPESFHPPFDKVVTYMHDHPEWDKNDIYLNFSPTSELDNAIRSISGLNGSAKSIDWARDLDAMRILWETGEKLERTGHKMKAGEHPEVLHLVSDLRMMDMNEESGLRLASEIDLTDVKSLQPCGWDIIDKTFGGIPVSGPLVVYATTKTGKTFWTSKLINEFLHYYPERVAAIFSLEMGGARYLKRSFDMYPTMKEVADRIWISGKARGMEDIIAETATREVDIIVIDGIRDAVQGEITPSLMDKAWNDVKRMGRLLEIPIVAVAQPNRMSKFNSRERFIGMYDIEWSGAAENAAEQMIALQYVSEDMDILGRDAIFPVISDAFYMISYFQRGGYPVQVGPGAVILNKHKKFPDGRTIMWESEAHGVEKKGVTIPTLYRPGRYETIGSRNSKRKA